MIDWSWNWFTQKRPIWQNGYGSCEDCSAAYAAAMRAYIQGYPLLEFSQLYLYCYAQGGPANIAEHQVGRGSGSVLPIFQTRGCCLESFMPCQPWQGVDTSTQAFSAECWARLRTPPSAAAEVDAANYKVVDWAYFATLYDGSMADMAAKGCAALDAGYTLTAFVPPNHEVCIWGYRADGWIGPDSHSTNAEPGWHPWGSIYIDAVVRNVVYKNATLGPKPTPLPKPGVVVAPPPPPPPPVIVVGNTQMLIDTIKTEANALVVGQITQAQIDTLKADVAKLVPDGVSQPPPTLGTSWKIVALDTTEHVDAVGTKWRARDWNNGSMALLRNGVYEGIAPSEAYYPGTGVVVYVKRGSNWWLKWNGTTWVYITAGELPPGY